MIRRCILAAGALLALAAATPDPVRAAEPVTIAIDHFQFGPDDITVEPGTIVEWVNRDQTIHNIIMPAAKLASPGMDTGDHFTFRFDTAGDFPYLCGLHPHMTGVVHVKAKAS